ncbi:hypothetical protein [Bradyrhizobium cenepequi]
MKVLEHTCPQCGASNPASISDRHTGVDADDTGRVRRNYLCRLCRATYQTLTDRDSGQARVVFCKKGEFGARASDAKHKLLAQVTCPDCNNRSRVVLTVRNDDGMFRTHRCRACSKRFVSCERDGVLVVGGKMPSEARETKYPRR